MIKGQFTALRAIERDDLSQLLAWRNQPELRRYFREYRELNHEQQLSWFNLKVNNDASTRMYIFCAPLTLTTWLYIKLPHHFFYGAVSLCLCQ